MRRAASFVAVLGAVAAVAELLVRTSVLDPVYFPPPTTVLWTLARLMGTAAFWATVGATVGAMLVGFAIAIMIAIPVGTMMGQFPRVRILFEPIVDSLRPMPSAAVIPVAILLLGLGGTMKTAVIVFGSIWPPILSTMDGIRGVDPVLIDTGRLLGLRGGTLLRRVVLPAALPSVLTGIRISLGIALILTVTTEMIAGTRGLGYFILDAQRSFVFADMFAGILALGAMGYILTVGFSWVERRSLFWHSSVRREAIAEVADDLPSDTMSGLDSTGIEARSRRALLNRAHSHGDLKAKIPLMCGSARRVLWIGMDGPGFAKNILNSKTPDNGTPDLTIAHWRPLALRQLKAELAEQVPEQAERVHLENWRPGGGKLALAGTAPFDVVGLTYALHDLSPSEVDIALRTVGELLGPGGRVLVATHAKSSFPELMALYRQSARSCGFTSLVNADFTHFDSFTQEAAPEVLRRFFSSVRPIDIDTSLYFGPNGLQPFLEYASIFPFRGMKGLDKDDREWMWTTFQQVAGRLDNYTVTKPTIVFECSGPKS